MDPLDVVRTLRTAGNWEDVLRKHPGIIFRTPRGDMLRSGTRAVKSSQTSHSLVCRFPLPCVVDRKPYVGRWTATLGFKRSDLEHYAATHLGVPLGKLLDRGLKYSLNIYGASFLKMDARLTQSGFHPGAECEIAAVLMAYGKPFAGHNRVVAIVVQPNRTVTSSILSLKGSEFVAKLTLNQGGVYRVTIVAEGTDPEAGVPFRREKMLTAAVFRPE
jgi:hypothetical protein